MCILNIKLCFVFCNFWKSNEHITSCISLVVNPISESLCESLSWFTLFFGGTYPPIVFWEKVLETEIFCYILHTRMSLPWKFWAKKWYSLKIWRHYTFVFWLLVFLWEEILIFFIIGLALLLDLGSLSLILKFHDTERWCEFLK